MAISNIGKYSWTPCKLPEDMGVDITLCVQKSGLHIKQHICHNSVIAFLTDFLLILFALLQNCKLSSICLKDAAENVMQDVIS